MASNPSRKLRRRHELARRPRRPRSALEAAAQVFGQALQPEAPVWAPPAPSIVHRWCGGCRAWHGPGVELHESNV